MDEDLLFPDEKEPPPDPAPEPAARREEWALRILLPAIVAALFVGVLLYERGARDVDVRVVAPLSVAPGDPVPVRALVFEGIGGGEGGQLVDRPARAGWGTDERAPDRISEPLSPSPAGGLEGRFHPPSDVSTPVLYMQVRLPEDEVARVQRQVRVQEPTDAPPPRTRLTTDDRAYQLRQGRVRDAALQLDARVPAGACVPELPCEVLVWVGGAEPSAVSIDARDGVEVLGEPPRPTTGIARFRVVVRALHAVIAFVARRGEGDAAEEFGRREMQVPLALGAVQLEADRYIAPAGSSPRVVIQSVAGDPAAALDVFRGGHLVALGHATSGEDAAAGVALPPLDPGLYHAQAHTSPFQVSSAGAAHLCAFDTEHGPTSCVTALAAAADAQEREDAFAEAWREAGPGGLPGVSAEDAFRFLSDARNIERYDLPPASSAVQQRAFGVDQRVGLGQLVVAVLVALMGVLAALLVMRRGLAGADEAARVHYIADELADAAHDDERDQDRADAMRWGVFGAAVLVFAAFLVVSMLVLSRG